MERKRDLTCFACGQVSQYNRLDTFWDDNGYGYSTRLINCPHCGKINILSYKEDRKINVNNDSRYYTYQR